MTLHEKKRLLVIACTWDRLEWTAAMLKRRRKVGASAFPAWLHAAVPLAIPFMPRWMRMGWMVLRHVK